MGINYDAKHQISMTQMNKVSEYYFLLFFSGFPLLFLADFGRQIEYFTINENESRISMSGFDSGCYFIEARSKGFSVVQRVIKQ